MLAAPMDAGDLTSLWPVVWVLSLLTVPSVLVQRAARPMAALSWILVLFVFPGVGVLAWWLFGRLHLRMKTRRRLRAEAEALRHLEAAGRRRRMPDCGTGQVLGLCALPPALKPWVPDPAPGNRVHLLPDAATAYAAWEAAIDAAERHVHLLFYIWEPDETGTRLRDALVRARERGVEVRLLLDGVGTPHRRFFEPLKRAGAMVHWFLPPWGIRGARTLNFRNHRKIVVVDAKRAFLGGINVGDEYLEWVDTAVEMHGPAVDAVQEVFLDDWYFATEADVGDAAFFGGWREGPLPFEPASAGPGEPAASCAIVPGGPHQELNAIREATLAFLASARQRLWLVTPYFIPDAGLLAVLRIARYRGVDVRVLLPAKSDVYVVRRASRTYYPELFQVGIRIFEHPGMVHAKMALVDTDRVGIGSANLDQRSFRLNFEVAALVASTDLNREVEAVWEDLMAPAVEVDPRRYEALPWRVRLVDAAFHLASPLL
ncbi:MAG: cardiolipin synthase [Deltaproteobacteria bacterium]|nr:MAG: cardiolipin synthase [Deltaproteobacteria bacterium]